MVVKKKEEDYLKRKEKMKRFYESDNKAVLWP